MNDQFVPYTLSERVRNLGFNEPCFAMWQKNKKLWYCAKKEWLYNFETEPDEEVILYHSQEYPQNIFKVNGDTMLKVSANFTAPTYDQVFKWFRDKGYDCAVINKDKDQGKFYGGYITYKGEEWSKSIGSNHKTYEEARLSCLEKLIEIIENEK